MQQPREGGKRRHRFAIPELDHRSPASARKPAAQA